MGKDDKQPPPRVKKELENPDKDRRTRKMFERMGVPTVKSIIDNILEKSGGSSTDYTIEELIEKAVYGAGASGGKFQRGSGKDESKPGAVRRPQLTDEQKKKLISGVQAKAANQAASTGMHGLAAKIKAEKSVDERTTDLVKSLYNIVNHKRFSKMDPDAGIDRKKEAAMEHGPTDKGKYVPGSKTFNNPQDSQDPKIRYKSVDDSSADSLEKSEEQPKKTERPKVPSKFFDKPEAERKRIVGERAWKNYDEKHKKSLDERTCDLTKDMSQQREREIHDAVTTIRMNREDVPEAANMDVNPEDVHRAHTLHSNLSKPQTLKSVCDKWQTGSAFMTKGARVMPLGPGGEVQTLAKDDASYHETDKKQEDVQSGKAERERKAKKRIADLGAE